MTSPSDRRTEHVPEVVVPHRGGVLVEVERVLRRNSSADDGLGPINSRRMIPKKEAGVKIVSSLEINERNNHQDYPDDCEGSGRAAQGTPAYQPRLMSATNFEPLRCKGCEPRGESEEVENDERGEREELANEHATYAGNGEGKRDAPEDSLD